MGLRSQNNPIASFRDVFSATGKDAVKPYVEPYGLTATGGVINDYTEGNKVYRAHIFTSSGTFEVTEPGTFGDTLEYLVVAGGGAGGGWSGSNGGGGGGAGGLRTNLEGHPKAAAVYPVSTGQYTVICGAGGAIQASPAPGKDGSNSEFHPTPQNYPSPSFIRSIGGGGGGYSPATGRSGGSSGGGAAPTNSIVPGNASPDPNHPQPQGNAGGHGGNNVSRGGGGGGGAAGDGGNCSGPYPGGFAGYGGLAMQVLIGGPSSNSPIGTPGPSGQGWFAGGGGGAGADESFPDSKRGIGGRGNDRNATTPWGGGGNGAPGVGAAPGPLGCNALGNTGGGGGGGRDPGGTQGNGASGIVVVRYQIAQLTATAKATGGAISYYGGKTIHTFTSSGTFHNPTALTVDFLMVGGGGGGGGDNGGGGAGGEVVTGTNYPLPASPRPVVIGSGGSGQKSNNNAGGDAGTSTTFNSLFARSGSGGGAAGLNGGKSGGPAASSSSFGGGGGAGVNSNALPGGSNGTVQSPTPTVTYPTGYGGGNGTGGPNYNAGGGAGAGQNGNPGAPTSPNKAGQGGDGVQNSILGTSYYWGGGGSGGQFEPPANSSLQGGRGGGGGGNTGPANSGPYGTGDTNGLFNGGNAGAGGAGAGANSTGGGGGGDGRVRYNGGNGGSGIFIIAYPS